MADTYTYPTTLTNKDLNPAWMYFRFYDRKNPTKSVEDDEISLYMPESASQPNTVTWDTEKFGFIGNAIAQRGGDQSIGGLISQGASLAAQRGWANLQSSLASRMGGQVSAEGVMGQTQGKIPNPYLTQIFKGVDFRNYSFVFKFFPFTQNDSDLIHNIIKCFRRNSLPSKENDGAFLGYPKEVEIKYMWKGEGNKYLHKFKRSVVTGVDIDYTPNGMFSVMRNGMPACIVMTIKLAEIELVMREDIAKGY